MIACHLFVMYDYMYIIYYYNLLYIYIVYSKDYKRVTGGSFVTVNVFDGPVRQAKPPQRQSFHRLWCLTVLLQGRHCYRISGNIHSIPYNVFLNRLYHVFPKHVQSHTPSKQFWNIGCLIVVVSSFGSLWPCMVVWIGAFLVQPPDGSVPLLEGETHCNCCLFFLLIATFFL